ncbi:RusA family crossover junction endodeoxyribonuclease [Phenylobacterium sp.]|jgi:crossover junction endodeoxyribonuclease RusA|uniref:RusA family crossover junction endodeoxyribonuclease n=1 Tax=Phenylobacterium sp. TaxID=1871053 RepID=UPI0037CC1ED3
MLPYPPSVNHYWRHVGGKVLVSREGQRYRSTVRLLLAGTRPLEGRLAVDVTLFPPDRRRRDVDNAMKGLLDSLADAGAYVDDSQIDDLRVRRGDVVEGGMARIEIREIETDGTP